MIYSLLIIGAGGLGRVQMSQALGDYGCGREWYPVGYLDSREPFDFPPDIASAIYGSPLTYVPRSFELFLPGVGDPRLRQMFVESLVSRGANVTGLRTRVSFGERCRIGNATFGLDAAFGPDCTIGDFSFFDASCKIGHDVHIGRYSHIGVNVIVAGKVRIGDRVIVHSGAMIASGVTIGDDAEVGMGAVVFKDVPVGTVVLGNPARMIRSNNEST